MIVRDFQSVIGRETREQCLERVGRLPDAVVACVGGGSNAAGMFYPFVEDAERRADRAPRPAAAASTATRGHALARPPGVLHGCFSYVLQDDDGQTRRHSISAGLDYPGVGPEHCYWKDAGRVRYESVTDAEALDAYHLLARREGILPALESSHALAHALDAAARPGRDPGSSASRAAATRTSTPWRRSSGEALPAGRLDLPDGRHGPGRAGRGGGAGGAGLLEIGIPYSDPLDRRPVGQRVRERDPDLEQAGAAPHRRLGEPDQVGVGHQVDRDDRRRELHCSIASTVSTSLSPRPERPTSQISPGRAWRSASDTAWADSSAGMIPSLTHVRWKAASASASVTGS